MLRDIWVWCKDMNTLPRGVKIWASLYPLPQMIGGLIFIQTLPGFVILFGRILSSIIQSQIHKRSPFSKLMGPVGHAHWLLIVPYLIFVLSSQVLSAPLFWFVGYVVGTTLISALIDVREVLVFLKRGHVEYIRKQTPQS